MRRCFVVLGGMGMAFASLEATEGAPATPVEAQEEAKIDELPVPLKPIRPVYPTRLLQEGLSGAVRVSYVVNVAGEAEDFVVLDSSHAEFTRAVMRALREVRFRPAQRQGEPVAHRVSQAFKFALADE